MLRIWRLEALRDQSLQQQRQSSLGPTDDVTPLVSLQCHRRAVNRIAVPASSRRHLLASCSAWLELRVWDVNSLFSADPMLAFHPDGS
ncbi:MAG: hypothetical protein Q8P67_21115, partial [archaeon]|nr:hypothetical protein [archaeon]